MKAMNEAGRYPPRVEDFSRVRAAAEAACEKAVAIKLKCCANLDDLHCTNVSRCLNNDEEWFWLIEIEEAAPDDAELKGFIARELLAQDIVARVVTEW